MRRRRQKNSRRRKEKERRKRKVRIGGDLVAPEIIVEDVRGTNTTKHINEVL